MKLSGLILKFMKNHIKLSELVYHTQTHETKIYVICADMPGFHRPSHILRKLCFKMVVGFFDSSYPWWNDCS